MSPALILSLLLLAPRDAGQMTSAPIADNSFLIEEAYNQEPGVVQHISVFTRGPAPRTWAYTFTQEWPVAPLPKHQFSYSVSVLTGTPDSSAGVGDAWINWRYQWIGNARWAVAPRASLIVPTGDAAAGRGAGGPGADVNLPVSISAGDRFVLHTNAGATLTRDRTASGRRGLTSTWRVGQSVVWLQHVRVNTLIEAVFSRSRTLDPSGPHVSANSLIVSPGVRWAHNVRGGLQIVPGLGVPVELLDTGSSRWSVLGYLSLEHPFGRRP